MSDPTPRRPGRQQERTERSTNALLNAASELIAEGGIDSLTFAAIGERAGYSRGLVTARFGNKDGLIEALIDRSVAQWGDREAAVVSKGRSGLDSLLDLMAEVRSQAENEPAGLRVLYALMFEAGTDPLLRERFAALHTSIRSDVEDVLEQGKRDASIRRDVDAGREAVLLLGALRGFAYQWQLDPEGFDLVDALGYLIEVTAERLRPAG